MKHNYGNAHGYTLVQVMVTLALGLLVFLILFALVAQFRNLVHGVRAETDFTRNQQATQYWVLRDSIYIQRTWPRDSSWFAAPSHFHFSLDKPGMESLVWIVPETEATEALLVHRAAPQDKIFSIRFLISRPSGRHALYRLVDPVSNHQALAWMTPLSHQNMQLEKWEWDSFTGSSVWNPGTRFWKTRYIEYTLVKKNETPGAMTLQRNINGTYMNLLSDITDCTLSFQPDRIRCRSLFQFLQRPPLILVWSFPHGYSG